jgi:hypothetical protein
MWVVWRETTPLRHEPERWDRVATATIGVFPLAYSARNVSSDNERVEAKCRFTPKYGSNRAGCKLPYESVVMFAPPVSRKAASIILSKPTDTFPICATNGTVANQRNYPRLLHPGQ